MIKIEFEEYLPYAVLAVIVLAIFYSIYFLKQLRQSKRGIKTMQMGRGKEKAVNSIERLLGFATLIIVPVQLLSIIFNWSYLSDNVRFTGFCVGLLGDFIFLISVVSMKDSWRAGIPDKDDTKLVTDGIYRFSRNPAFLGFDLQYIGIMLMYFNLLTGCFTVFAIIMLHLQIRQEERYLSRVFGREYEQYCSRVLRYLGCRRPYK